jgi:hypothetical protein
MVMFNRFTQCSLVLAVVTLLGSLNNASAVESPFKLSGEGGLLFNPQETLSGPFAAAGHATHLGLWSNVGYIQFVPISPTKLANSGVARFQAADGDLLDMTFVGSLDPTTGHATATFTIVGGTGRFQYASGSLQMSLDHAADGTFVFTLDGTIDY